MNAQLFKKPGVVPFMVAQFCGALNDNFLKNSLIILLAYRGIEVWGLKSDLMVALAGALFILPFFLFSTLAGKLADKYQRTNIMRIVKWAEVGIMLLSAFSFFTHQYGLLLIALMLMGFHSTFFGPVKYSMIPELVDAQDITSANAVVEASTFMAILIGTLLGGFAAAHASAEWVASAGLILVSLVGLVTSYKVPKVHVANPNIQIGFNLFRSIGELTRQTFKVETLFHAIVGISWFWALGAAILSILPVFAKNFLQVNEQVVTFFLTIFTVGIGAGSAITSLASKEGPPVQLVKIGAIGMSVFLVDWAWGTYNWTKLESPELLAFLAQPAAWRLTIDLFAIAVCGGLFTVPLYSLMQIHSERAYLSQTIATNNIYNALFMVISSLMLMAFYAFNLGWVTILFIFAFLNLAFGLFVARHQSAA